MDPWFGKGAVLAAALALVAIRAPHGQRSRSIPVALRRKGAAETALLALAWVSFLVPLLWVATPLLSFAAVPLHPAAWGAGVALLGAGLRLFHRSHADLGRNWSITLEVREGHTLVTGGVYGRVRHPMYAALLLYSLGQALAVPNLVAGPSYLLAMVLLCLFRIGPEERMMAEAFGADWEAYRSRTRRLIPGVL